MMLQKFFSFSRLRKLFREDSQGTNEFELTDSMWGFMMPLDGGQTSDVEVPDDGEEAYRISYEAGKKAGNKLFFEVTLRVDNFKEFIAPSGRRAPMTGYVTCLNLYGEKLPISNGEYGLYWVDPKSGERRISYRFDFCANGGSMYRFSGIKKIVDDEKTFDILADQTTLFAVIRKLDDETPLVARGIIHYHVVDFPQMVLSIRTPSDDTLLNRIRMTLLFFSFVNKELGEYFQSIKPTYRAQYNKIVMSGKCHVDGAKKQFFFFAGVHDKGFPWGDNVGFADIGLVIQQADGWRRYVVSAHSLPGLKLRLSEGILEFEEQRLYQLTDGKQISFSDLQSPESGKNLKSVQTTLKIRFSAKQVEKKQIPFECNFDALRKYHPKEWGDLKASDVSRALAEWRDVSDTLGYSSEVLRITNVQGSFDIDGHRHDIQVSRTLGEAEIGSISSFRAPPLYYNYFCAIEPEFKLFRIFIRSGILQRLSMDTLYGKASSVLGNVVGQFVRKSIEVTEEGVSPLEWDFARSLTEPTEEILEINNDHFPTAVFQRRIVALPGLKGERALALEEDMSTLNLEPQGTDRNATVAVIRNPDRFAALDDVMAKTGFWDTLERTRQASGKEKTSFAVIVKPSFSFMYSLADCFTYTDPEMVEHLVDRLYKDGYRNIAVAESQNTYATFFTNREVPTLAKYVGYTPRNYRIIDLSEDTVPHDFGGTLGKHHVHPTWRDADFRISFAKNKTHAYAYYALTIENIYGALPEVNKFQSYHCNKGMGIYKPTIDYLAAFPIHFGFIDAYMSADGAFGIFADTEPNFTETVIGGDDLIAVDWVAASKMGVDPMVSVYMREAVDRFGKPDINLIGDHSLYRRWRNVPEIVSKAAHGIIGENCLFGDFLYSVMASMDPFFQFKPNEVGRRVGRVLTKSVRKGLFEWITGNREELTVDHLKRILDPDQVAYMHDLLKSIIER